MINGRFMIGIALFVGLCGCGQRDESKGEEGEASVKTVLPASETEVETETLRTVDFEDELVSNGRISAQQVAELQFASLSSGNIPVRIFVKNGDRVEAGAAIAMLDTFQLSNNLRQSRDNLQRAYLDLQDVLIGQRLSISDSASIPPETLQLAYIRSGYNTNLNQFEMAKFHFENATLRTPIAGTVINLFSKPYCAINTSEPFCTILSEGKPEVDFRILENELPKIKIGDKVKIQAYASPDIVSEGTIAGINPNVDREGTVRVKAFIQPHPRMINGMNVRISVYRAFGKHWVVPKTAVVLRTGKQVVFAYKDGKAAWNYVTTGLENATHYSITSETLKEGDEIIFRGNEHLADGTSVKLVSSE